MLHKLIFTVTTQNRRCCQTDKHASKHNIHACYLLLSFHRNVFKLVIFSNLTLLCLVCFPSLKGWSHNLVLSVNVHKSSNALLNALVRTVSWNEMLQRNIPLHVLMIQMIPWLSYSSNWPCHLLHFVTSFPTTSSSDCFYNSTGNVAIVRRKITPKRGFCLYCAVIEGEVYSSRAHKIRKCQDCLNQINVMEVTQHYFTSCYLMHYFRIIITRRT